MPIANTSMRAFVSAPVTQILLDVKSNPANKQKIVSDGLKKLEDDLFSDKRMEFLKDSIYRGNPDAFKKDMEEVKRAIRNHFGDDSLNITKRIDNFVNNKNNFVNKKPVENEYAKTPNDDVSRVYANIPVENKQAKAPSDDVSREYVNVPVINEYASKPVIKNDYASKPRGTTGEYAKTPGDSSSVYAKSFGEYGDTNTKKPVTSEYSRRPLVSSESLPAREKDRSLWSKIQNAATRAVNNFIGGHKKVDLESHKNRENPLKQEEKVKKSSSFTNTKK